ncbi:hypothetical protein [Telmatospirillum sp. J64-1]|uniref:hypothetical protein n=1 Tax=Telmatospirillum sp. J64-1 TaxID=2502183 RepID=UPI00115D75C2|nr:hypothetical protein [Telmatospirillum sp. J64-1]
MGRQPVHLSSCRPGNKPSGRQGIWEAIRRHRDGFTATSLAQATDINRAMITTYLSGLQAAGYIRQVGTETVAGTRLVRKIFALDKDIGIEAPRVTRTGQPVTQGLAREQMWRTMKMLGDFTAADLAAAASTESHPVAEIDAEDYCKHLTKAGYLQVMGKRPMRWRFVKARNTGSQAPMVQRIKSVYDPNLRQVVWWNEKEAEA